MAKILDLDKLDANIGKARELRINGRAYPIIEMTVENFIETTQTAARLAAEGADAPAHVVATIDMICRSVPTLERKELEGRPLEILNTIAAFVRGDEIDVAEEAGDDAGK